MLALSFARSVAPNAFALRFSILPFVDQIMHFAFGCGFEEEDKHLPAEDDYEIQRSTINLQRLTFTKCFQTEAKAACRRHFARTAAEQAKESAPAAPRASAAASAFGSHTIRAPVPVRTASAAPHPPPTKRTASASADVDECKSGLNVSQLQILVQSELSGPSPLSRGATRHLQGTSTCGKSQTT